MNCCYSQPKCFAWTDFAATVPRDIRSHYPRMPTELIDGVCTGLIHNTDSGDGRDLLLQACSTLFYL